MNDSNLFEFMDIFRMVARVFPLRGEENEIADVSRAYFKSFRRFTLDQVRAGADNCIAGLERFPKPREWIKHIPVGIPLADVPELSALELSEYRAAEKLGFEGEPCGCGFCRAASIDHRPIRFVPDQPELRVRITQNLVSLRGHWAHGAELVGYYRARDHFWSLYHAMCNAKSMTTKARKGKSFAERLEDIYKPRLKLVPSLDREPGEDG